MLAGILLAATVIAVFGVAVHTTVLPLVKDDHTLTVEHFVPVEALDSLPQNVEPFEDVPVRVRIEDTSIRHSAAALAGAAIPLTVAVIVFYSLFRLVGSVRTGDPFNLTNVRRLRTMGLALLIGDPLGEVVAQVVATRLAVSAGVDNGYVKIEGFGDFALVGVGLLVLSQVFRHGVRLREDVEATI